MERPNGGMSLVYQEKDRRGNILAQQKMSTEEELLIVERQTGESVRVLLRGDGRVSVTVIELAVHKKRGSSYMSFVSHIWDPSVAERDPDKVWTRVGPLPFGVCYEKESQSLSWCEGQLRKSLIWSA